MDSSTALNKVREYCEEVIIRCDKILDRESNDYAYIAITEAELSVASRVLDILEQNEKSTNIA